MKLIGTEEKLKTAVQKENIQTSLREGTTKQSLGLENTLPEIHSLH
jgi:hypothetical protein